MPVERDRLVSQHLLNSKGKTVLIPCARNTSVRWARPWASRSKISCASATPKIAMAPGSWAHQLHSRLRPLRRPRDLPGNNPRPPTSFQAGVPRRALPEWSRSHPARWHILGCIRKTGSQSSIVGGYYGVPEAAVHGSSGPLFRFFCSEGAHCRAEPMKSWAQAMTGQPPAGGVPSGTSTTPDTATSSPLGERE